MKGVAETLFLLGTLVAFGLLITVWAFSTPGALERLLSPSDPSASPSYGDGGEVAGEEDIYKPESMGQRGNESDRGGSGGSASIGSGSDTGGNGDTGGDSDRERGFGDLETGLRELDPGIAGLPPVEIPEDNGVSETLSTVVNKGGLNE